MHVKIAIGLIVLTLAALGRAVFFDFVRSDDPNYVSNNPHVLSGLSRENVAWAFSNLDVGFYIPITFLSLQLDASLFGPQPWGFHLTNLILHLANVVLVYRLAWRLTGKPELSALVAGLFAVHPMHVESVAWITERKDVLSGFFFLLMLLTYLRYVERQSLATYLAMVGLFVLSLWSKPMVVTSPVLLLLLDYWPLRRQATLGRLFLEKIPLLFVGMIQTFVTLFAHDRAGAFNPHWLTPEIRMANAIESVGWYVVKTFMPWNLGNFYPFNLLTMTSPSVLFGLGLLLVLTGLAWKFRDRFAELPFGWAWFLVALTPVLGVVAPLADTARGDRFVYLAHIGLFLALVTFATRFIPAHWQRPIGAACLVSLAALSYLQVGFWKDHTTLYSHTLEVTQPDNYRVLYSLAYLELDQGNLEQAEAYMIAGRSHPLIQWDENHLKGLLALKRGQTVEAIKLLSQAHHDDPRDPRIVGDLASAFMYLNQFEEAARWLEQVQNSPKNTNENLLNLGMCYLKLNRAALAISPLQKAVTITPEKADAHFLLGMAYVMLGRPAEAISYLERAVELNPNDVEARQNLMKLRN